MDSILPYIFDLKKVVVELSKGNLQASSDYLSNNDTSNAWSKIEESQAPQKPQIIMDNPTKDIHGQFNNDGFNEAEIIEESLSIADKEKELIIKALQKHNGRRKDAAEDLGISERTLYRKIKDYELDL